MPWQFTEKKSLFNKWCRNSWIFTCKNKLMSINIYLTTYKISNSKQITVQILRNETTKLLVKSIRGKKSHNLRSGKDLLNMTIKVQPIKKKKSVQFSHSVVFASLPPNGLQHARLPCPSPTPGACSNSCPSSQ